MDLKSLKGPWLNWCKVRGVIPSDAFRQIVAKLVAASGGPGKFGHDQISRTEKPTVRRWVTLTASEAERVEALAATEGFSPARWILALVRVRLTNTAQLGQRELELLDMSNMRLLAIGRNLNQIAKALNTNPGNRSVYRIDDIRALDVLIRQHTQTVGAVITSNIDRWGIK
jgi:hypothetical protein